MSVIRRLALHVALPLSLVAVAPYGWYQLSDAGKRWRYEDRLATFCEGLIPYEQSAFPGLTRCWALSGGSSRALSRGSSRARSPLAARWC